MSTFTPVKFNAGTTAASADHNANVAAMNAASAAGQIEEPNIRQEGIDHHNIADNSVEATDRAGATRFFESSTPSGAIAAPAKVTMGGLDVEITAITVSSGDSCVVRCAAWIEGPAIPGTDVTLTLQVNDGSGYVTVTSTQRRYSASAAANLEVDYCVTTLRTTAGTFSFRLYVSAVAVGTINVKDAVLFAEVIAR